MIEKVLENIRKNRMEAYFVPTKEDVLPLVKELVAEGATVSNGGSVTLKETGISDLLHSGYYTYADRTAPGISNEDKERIEREAFFADAYFCSANAITEQGELVNVDGHANRVAAIAFGPQSVIVVAGINKIVKNVEEGIRRIKTVAAPRNTKRLSCNTYCNKADQCMGLDGELTAGCASPDRICCSYLICGPQRTKNRIKVILVGEELGY